MKSHKPGIGERAPGPKRVGKRHTLLLSPRLSRRSRRVFEGSSATTRARTCRPMSWTTEEEGRDKEDRRAQSFALAIVRNVGERDAAETLHFRAPCQIRRHRRHKRGETTAILERSKGWLPAGQEKATTRQALMTGEQREAQRHADIQCL
jgi:hypothetical protein